MDHFFEVIRQTRENFINLADKLSMEQLNQVPASFNNNILWNFGHIVVTQQVLCYQLSGLDTGLDAGLAARYRKGTKPEGFIAQQEYDLLKELAFSTLAKLKKDYEAGLFTSYTAYTTSYGVTLSSVNEAIQFAGVHEGVHYGYALALKRALGIV